MPKKNIYANIKPYEGQDINQYRDYVKTSIKQNDPELNDVFLDDLADEYISTSKPSQKVQVIAQPTQPAQPTQSAPQRPSKLVEQMMAATSKKQVLPTPTAKKPLKPQAETTGEALSEFLPQMQAPTLKDPFAEATKVTNPALESLLATGVQGEPKKVEAPVQSAPSVSNRLLEQEAAQIPLRNQISKEIAQRQKDAFDIEAERNLPQGDEAQKQAFAQTLRDNELAKQQYQGQLKANQIPRGEFDKIIDLNATAEKNIARAELASTLAPKGSNDVSSIKEMLDEYSRSPEFQTDVYTYAQGNSIPDLKEAASKMLDQKAKEFTQAPSTIQRGLSEFANTKFGRAISPVTRGVQAAIKAPVEIGGFLGAVASSLGEVYKDPSKSLTETIAKKNQANQAIAGRFVPSLAPTKQATTNFEAIADFLGDVGESVGAIEGGMTATRGLGNFFDKARKVGAYGSTSEMAQLAAHSGKTMATDVLSKASQVLRGKNAIKTAQILDNTTKNMIMMGGQTMEAKRQEYEDAGFSPEEAADKAKNAAIISSFALSLPGVMRPHNESMVKNIVGESGYKGFTPLQDLLQRGKGAVKQGVNFAVDMAAINAATGGYDKLFEGGLKQAGHDFLVGAVSRVMSGQDGIRKVSQSQKRALVDAIESPDKLNLSITESGGSPEQIKTARSFIETIRPYYNEAVNERGYNKEQAIEDAIERTKMVQAGRKLAQMEAQAPLYQGENKEFNLEYERLNDIYNTSRQALEAVKNGISLNPNRLVSADQMAEIVKNYSIVRPEQKVPIELNAPYYSEPIPTTELAKDPKVQDALKQFEGSELVNDAYIDVVPVIGENGEVIDGAKGAAAAIARGQKQMYAFKSTSTNDVKKVANELYQESVSDKPDFEGLDEVHTTALKEMRKVYDKTMRETNEDIYEGVNSVVKDALERGYDKADVINMARKVNNGILSETVVEKMYNDQMKEKVEPVKEVAEEVAPKEATEEMQVVSENPKEAAETEQIAETTKEINQPSEKVEQIETPTKSVTEVKIEPTKEPVSKEKEPQVENEALKDVESTAKALKGVDLEYFIENKYPQGLISSRFYSDAQEQFIAFKGLTNEQLFDENKRPDFLKTQEQRVKFNDEFKKWTKKNKENIISEAYHKAKANGSNPELVEAVENLLGGKKEQPKTKEVMLALKDVESTAKKILGESAVDKLKKQGYKIVKGKFNRDAYADFFGVGEGLQADELAKSGLTIIKPNEKIKVFRGVGKNVKKGDNNAIQWVAEDERIAKNYSSQKEVQQLDVDKPQKAFENPENDVYVTNKDVANRLRKIRDRLFRDKSIDKKQAEIATSFIDEFEKKSGDNPELYSTKTNKKESADSYAKALISLGYDGILQKESFDSKSPFKQTTTENTSNTYGIFNPELVKAVEELLTPKTQENAISQPKTNEVFPRKQGEIREAGSERKGVGQGEQRAETPRKDSEGIQKENVEQKVIPEKEAKKAFEDVLTAHVKELNKDEVSAVELKKAAEKAEEAKAKSEDIKFLSENFKDVLLLLKEKAGIEVKNIEDC